MDVSKDVGGSAYGTVCHRKREGDKAGTIWPNSRGGSDRAALLTSVTPSRTPAYHVSIPQAGMPA